MKAYRDLCDEMHETMFGVYSQHHQSHGGKMRRVSHVRSLRHNQLFNKTRKAGMKCINTPQLKSNASI